MAFGVMYPFLQDQTPSAHLINGHPRMSVSGLQFNALLWVKGNTENDRQYLKIKWIRTCRQAPIDKWGGKASRLHLLDGRLTAILDRFQITGIDGARSRGVG
jgi:hypothetical protein